MSTALDWLPGPDRSDPVADALEAFLDAAERCEGQLPRWTPQEGPQREFYESACDEVLYGGAAGGGKSSAAAALPLRWAEHPRYRALILRRETTQLQELLDEARAIYKIGDATSGRPFLGAWPKAEYRGDKNLWTLPSGAQVRFNHCQRDTDALDYQGQQYQTIVFDELTHFTEYQYLEIKSRNRSGAVGIPCYTRATTNPGGPGHEWVFRRWGPWLDPECTLPDWEEQVLGADGVTRTVVGRGLPPRTSSDGKPLPPARGGQILYVAKVGGVERFSSEPFTIDRVDGIDVRAQSRTFIPARLSDNKALLASDPGYRATLRDNNEVRRAQLEDGNWLVKKGDGLFFKREWFEFVDEVPALARRCRAWDLAATEPSPENADPDWTVGLLLARDALGWIIEDVVRFRVGPGAVAPKVRATAELDGRAVTIRIPQDPGQAGKDQAAAYVRMLTGFKVHTKPITGDKETRAAIVSTQARPESTGGVYGRIRMKRAPWNAVVMQILEAFPTKGVHDDDVDALSDAFDELSVQHVPPRRDLSHLAPR